MNSFKRVRTFQMELEFGLKCWFFRRGENRSTRIKTYWSKGENQQQTLTHIRRRRRDLNLGHIVGRRVLSPTLITQPLLPREG